MFSIYGRGGHLCQVTSIILSGFHFLVPESFHKKKVQIGTVVSEKIWFVLFYDTDLQNSHTFIYSNRCLLLLTFRSLAAIVSEKSTVFTFFYRKALVTKFYLAVK